MTAPLLTLREQEAAARRIRRWSRLERVVGLVADVAYYGICGALVAGCVATVVWS